MSIGRGTRIGPYEVLSPLGQGGMGVVFRALDTKLQREVALKLLPDHFADDPERLARFQREAQVLATLNHPNIAQIHGLEESEGSLCIVMELVEGQTIEDRIKRAPIPIDEALQIAKQIAEAVEAAHEKGIIHRDLKPANIKITPDGKVKVLDFGLAKAGQEPAATLANSPTLMSASVPGTLIGTAAYMSPEQVKGQEADRTSDVWAFGCVLYEMLTGRMVFQGETLSEVIAAILRSAPDWDRLPAETTEDVRRLLRRCLQKDRKRRLQNIGDARIEIEEMSVEASPPREAERVPVRSKERLLWAFSVVVIGLIAAVAWWWPARNTSEADRPLIRLSADLGPEAVTGSMISTAISPDGSRIVFPIRDSDGRQVLATRRLDEAKTTRLAGTEGAINPFFSQDGQWIGFFSGGLKKVLVQGGSAPVTLASINNSRGATWLADGSIIAPLSNGSALSRVPADRGTPQLLTELDQGELSQRWPQILPGGRAVLFTGRSPTLNSYENASIDVVTLETKTRKTIWRGGYFGRYLPTRGNRGHLVYIHEGVMFAAPFDPERLELEGTPVAVIEGIASDPASGGGQFDVSTNGTLVYLEGVGLRSWPMVWLDAAGKTEPILPKPGMYYSPRFSPDGRRLAFAIEAGNGSDVFVYDFASQSTTRLSFTQQGNIEPVWTPDGKHIVYRSIRPAALWWLRADGGGEPQRLRLADGGLQAYSFSPDGTRLAYHERNSANNFDISILPLDMSDPDRPKPGAPQLISSTPANETLPAFSPDGRWLAYVSDESGQGEVYVRRVSEAGGKWQASVGGGNIPVWSRTSRELFYLVGGTRIMVADYDVTGDSFVARKRREWSPLHILSPGFVNLDLAPDGKRFAVFLNPEAKEETKGTVHVTFLLNFFDELRRRAPAAKN